MMSFHKLDEGKTFMFLFKIFHYFWVQSETKKDLKNFSEETGNHVKETYTLRKRGFFMLYEFAKTHQGKGAVT